MRWLISSFFWPDLSPKLENAVPADFGLKRRWTSCTRRAERGRHQTSGNSLVLVAQFLNPLPCRFSCTSLPSFHAVPPDFFFSKIQKGGRVGHVTCSADFRCFSTFLDIFRDFVELWPWSWCLVSRRPAMAHFESKFQSAISRRLSQSYESVASA